MQIGERLKDLRVRKELKQTELAEALGIEQGKISRLEKGGVTYSIDDLLTISKYFNVSTDYLLGLTDNETAVNTSDGQLLRAICEYTGLTQEVVTLIAKYKGTHFNNLISAMYTVEAKDNIGVFEDKLVLITQFFDRFIDLENEIRKLTQDFELKKNDKLIDCIIYEACKLEDFTECEALCEFEAKKIGDEVEKIVYSMFQKEFSEMREFIKFENTIVKLKHVKKDKTDKYFSW